MSDPKFYISVKKIPRFRRLRPGIVIASVMIIGALLLTLAILDIRYTRREIVSTLDEQGRALMESLQKSLVNATRSFVLLEEILAEKLLSMTRLFEEMDYQGSLTREKFAQLCEENQIFRGNVFNEQGERIMSNAPWMLDNPKDVAPQQGQRTLLSTVLTGEDEELLLGFMQGRFGSGQRFAVAKHRRQGGAIVLNIDAREMLKFRRTIGAGRLVRDIGETEGVIYVLLQDSLQVILASQSMENITPIQQDSFLQQAFMSSETMTRMSRYQDQPVFEIARSLELEDRNIGVLRIALSTEHLQAAVTQTRQRVIITSVLLLIIGVIAVNALARASGMQMLQNAYHRIETYTGSMLTNMTDAVVAMNNDGLITVFNRAAEQLFKLDATEVLGQPCETIGPDICELIYESQTGESVRNKEVWVGVKDQELYVSVSVSQLPDSQGKVETIFAVIKDLTEHKRLEENLKRRDQLAAMGHLASGVAHEIRNPLNAISMLAQRLRFEFEPRQEAQEYDKMAATMVSEIKRINTIIQQFLEFARPSAMQLQAVNICELSDELMTLTRPQAEQKNIKLQSRCSVDEKVPLDRSKLQQALLNLIQNGIDACSNGDHIHIDITIENKELVIKVSDTGRGILEKHISRIFNLYFTTKEQGTGIGLSLVQQIVSQHSGTIEVVSRPAFKGTLFTIYIPILELR
jgi:two-component system, NtrC family, sensor histidine kinase HydH